MTTVEAGPSAPIFLLADSQLLFRSDRGPPLLARVLRAVDLPPGLARSVYLGASNGDEPAYHELCVAALAAVGLVGCRHIREQPSADDLTHVAAANVIVLAGGDVERGWRSFGRHRLTAALQRRHREGAVLLGVSAGAVQLGLPWLSLVPLTIEVHDEPGWERLRGRIGAGGADARGLGIPAGGGVIYQGDGALATLGAPALEVRMVAGALRETALLPAT